MILLQNDFIVVTLCYFLLLHFFQVCFEPGNYELSFFSYRVLHFPQEDHLGKCHQIFGWMSWKFCLFFFVFFFFVFFSFFFFFFRSFLIILFLTVIYLDGVLFYIFLLLLNVVVDDLFSSLLSFCDSFLINCLIYASSGRWKISHDDRYN